MTFKNANFIIVIMLILNPLFSHAKPSFARVTNIQVDSFGNLTTPDLYHYMQGLKYYNKGKKDTALIKFKFAAEFGSRQAIKFIGIMYMNGDGIPRDLVQGRAWLKLAASRGDHESIKVSNNYDQYSNIEENNLVKKTYDDLIENYGRTVVLNNVYKYYRRFKFHTLLKPNTIKFQNQKVVLSELKIRRLTHEIKEFYLETNKKMGEVIQGEIITKDD